jgi:hypothetical protein
MQARGENCAPFGEIARQHPLQTATFQQVKNCAKDLVEIHPARFCALALALQQWENLLELLSAEATRILLPAHPFTIAHLINREQILRTLVGSTSDSGFILNRSYVARCENDNFAIF